MKTICVILARSGSKGLPGKNSRPLAGKPLVAWTIEHAQGSHRMDRIVLSTDGEDLADIGRSYQVEVVLRPAELASDTATVDGAARHAVAEIEKRHADKYDAVVILYGNVPVRPPNLADSAIQKLETTGADSVQSVCPVEKYHPYWMRVLGGEGGDTLAHYQANEVYRRQDLPPVYQIDGGVIAVTRQSLFTVAEGRPHAFLGRDCRAVVTQPGQVVDVDSQHDLTVAEAFLKDSQEGIT